MAAVPGQRADAGLDRAYPAVEVFELADPVPRAGWVPIERGDRRPRGERRPRAGPGIGTRQRAGGPGRGCRPGRSAGRAWPRSRPTATGPGSGSSVAWTRRPARSWRPRTRCAGTSRSGTSSRSATRGRRGRPQSTWGSRPPRRNPTPARPGGSRPWERPFSAIDGDEATVWRSNEALGTVGQWIEFRLLEGQPAAEAEHLAATGLAGDLPEPAGGPDRRRLPHGGGAGSRAPGGGRPAAQGPPRRCGSPP